MGATTRAAIANRWATTPRLLRFLVVGGINTVFGYCAYASLLFVGLHYGWAALLGTIAGVIFNYFTTGGLVFDRLGQGDLVRFVLVYVVIYLLNVAALAVLEHFGVGPYIGGLACILPMALVSFLLMRTFVFAERPCP